MDEDAEFTLIYVDMLGFGALIKDNPTRLVHRGPDKCGFTSTSTSPLQMLYKRFHRVLESCIANERLCGGIQAMLFSDCAFLNAGNSLRAGLIATNLMRQFLVERVQVRMGIGRGTFYAFGFSTDVSGDTTVSRSQFAGTAVINAHAAERYEGKGMRIFVHPSLRSELSLIKQRIKLLPLPKSNQSATWELDYLCEARPTHEQPLVDKADKELFEAVNSMKNPKAKFEVRRHYIETHNALNRMRLESNRTPFPLRQLNSTYIEPGPF